MGIINKDGWCPWYDTTQMSCVLDDSIKLILCPCWKTPEHPVCETYKADALDMTPDA